jgi:hypothetical protein
MSGECEFCREHALDCTCEGDYRESYQHMNQYWSKAKIDVKFTHLNSKLKPLVDEFGGVNPPSELPLIRQVNVNGREEHEELLRNEQKMLSLGLDPIYERIVYLKRWGGWLHENKD